jgi:hypothetical protein
MRSSREVSDTSSRRVKAALKSTPGMDRRRARGRRAEEKELVRCKRRRLADDVGWGSEERQRVNGAREIVRRLADEKIQVLRESRFGVDGDRSATDDEVFNVRT